MHNLARASKVRAGGGRVGGRAAIAPDVRAMLEARWAEVVTS